MHVRFGGDLLYIKDKFLLHDSTYCAHDCIDVVYLPVVLEVYLEILDFLDICYEKWPMSVFYLG